jgi:hypothetical protein
VSDPVLNTELLERVVEFAVEHHDSNENADKFVWDQTNWRFVTSCGTAMCVAGITCQLSGGKWADESSYFLISEAGDPPGFNRYLNETVDRPVYIHAAARAQHLLGLTDNEKGYLFDCDYNDTDELKLRAKQIINGESRHNG